MKKYVMYESTFEVKSNELKNMVSSYALSLSFGADTEPVGIKEYDTLDEMLVALNKRKIDYRSFSNHGIACIQFTIFFGEEVEVDDDGDIEESGDIYYPENAEKEMESIKKDVM